MKRSIAVASSLAFVAIAFALATHPAHGDDAPGLALFKKQGCNECHAISALSVAVDAKKKDAAAAEAQASASKKKKKDAPDLSGVGLEHDAKWISAFLNKEETLNGEKHEKRFKGTEADRRTIASWLATLKTETKKAPAPSEPAGEAGKGESQGG